MGGRSPKRIKRRMLKRKEEHRALMEEYRKTYLWLTSRSVL